MNNATPAQELYLPLARWLWPLAERDGAAYNRPMKPLPWFIASIVFAAFALFTWLTRWAG